MYFCSCFDGEDPDYCPIMFTQLPPIYEYEQTCTTLTFSLIATCRLLRLDVQGEHAPVEATMVALVPR